MKRLERLVSCMLIACLLLCAAPSMAEEEATWVCPNCGREGLIKAFCGTCRTPSPAPDAVDKTAPTPEPAWTCRNCGAKSLTGKYCDSCGSPATWDCPSCGKKGLTSTFCNECGAPHQTATPTPSPTPTPMPVPVLTSESILNSQNITGIRFHGFQFAQLWNDGNVETCGEQISESVIDNTTFVAILLENTLDHVITIQSVRITLDNAPVSSLDQRIELEPGVKSCIWSAISGSGTYKLYIDGRFIGETVLTITPDEKAELSVGQVVLFGRYEQDGNASNGKEDIQWLILEYDERAGRALLISKYALDAKAFYHVQPYPTWAKSDIRKWLNETFLSNAFTIQERSAILKTSVHTPDYHGNPGGNDTEDLIFLLSQSEASRYFEDDYSRKAYPTVYAIKNGLFQNTNVLTDPDCCCWWLRSPGRSNSSGFRVSSDGSLDSGAVSNKVGGIRPALWVDLFAANP